ncbi:unnamed protein product [Protopolystoma xenopodis]|uniref:Uncharacterized protein n=1 Tax=Protopolystoma xenopodis TaxID=117903 RepID=A0A3S5BWS5_9PLAT|nr:unnamed protein product [Protopolystoma xenopodis]
MNTVVSILSEINNCSVLIGRSRSTNQNPAYSHHLNRAPRALQAQITLRQSTQFVDATVRLASPRRVEMDNLTQASGVNQMDPTQNLLMKRELLREHQIRCSRKYAQVHEALLTAHVPHAREEEARPPANPSQAVQPESGLHTQKVHGFASNIPPNVYTNTAHMVLLLARKRPGLLFDACG